MNNEYKFQIRAFLKLLCVCGFALLYGLGGVEHKELRRYVAPLFITSCMWLFSRNWRVFIQAPLLMLTLSLGYGAEVFWVKIVKRLFYGTANALTIYGQWWSCKNKQTKIVMVSLNLIIVPLVIVVLGVFNPINARSEELVIGFIIGLLSMYTPDDKE